ncbi:MAG: 50S ribosomal protein L6 [Alphaproteobacteria bacterium]|nr:50S ribosomal protein L6 [Alphaproteobacteria bacterium]MDE2336245.1 50S ribosomal protein L6 [Alphaproteobacteria bacterium]
MSRIAKHPIKIPAGVDVKVGGGKMTVKGKKGELHLDLVGDISAEVKDGAVTLKPRSTARFATDMWGTTASNLRNMIKGVTEGYSKKLLLEGVGFRAAMKGKDLVLQIGFSHEVNYKTPQGIEIKAPKQTEIEISGIDKQKVGQVAAEIYHMKPPEPYKGKGFRYEGQIIRRKEGKKK